MASFVPTPAWFYGVDSALEIVAVLISFLISFYGFHIYRFFGQKKYLYFSISFFLIGISLIIGAVTNYLLYFVWLKHSPLYVKANNLMLLYKAGFLVHFFLHLAAYMILMILCLKLTDRRVISLLFLFVILSVFIAEENFISFYVISFILMAFYILPFFYKNYVQNKSNHTKIVLLAFAAISLSQLLFLLSVYSDLAYVLGHVSQVAGYIALLVNFVSVFRK